jgi:elongator complex protein 3
LLLGFIRLRLSNALTKSIIPELKGKTAMVRELHCYGRVKQVGSNDASGTQHFGIGKTLLTIAETISSNAGYEQMAIISGIGVRDYYRKRGYELRGTYMMKHLEKPKLSLLWLISIILLFLAIIVKQYNL